MHALYEGASRGTPVCQKCTFHHVNYCNLKRRCVLGRIYLVNPANASHGAFFSSGRVSITLPRNRSLAFRNSRFSCKGEFLHGGNITASDNRFPSNTTYTLRRRLASSKICSSDMKPASTLSINSTKPIIGNPTRQRTRRRSNQTGIAFDRFFRVSVIDASRSAGTLQLAN